MNRTTILALTLTACTTPSADHDRVITATDCDTVFPLGVAGGGGWPQMSGGTNWMLRNFGDCHNPL